MHKNYNFCITQDWAAYFEKIFNAIKITNMLEFGLGLGTRFLCDNCEKVTSVELSVSDLNRSWTENTKQELSDYKNWSLHYIEVPSEIKMANEAAIESRYPLQDLTYLPILQNLISPFLQDYYDMIFVDAGIHNRGDIVNCCFQKGAIIAAHDTDRTGRIKTNIYGYNIIKIPDNYTEVHFNDSYCGTTIWVKNDHENSKTILEALQ
jgi:hypothetical protein